MRQSLVVFLNDNISLSYQGNRVTGAYDAADHVALENSLDFDAGDGDALYGYDADGRLTSDTGRGITSISYAPNDRPVRTQMDDTTFDYTYSADGRKLKAVITSAIGKFDPIEPPIVVGPLAESRALTLTSSEVRYYIGPFELTETYPTVVKNQKPGLARINMSWGYVDPEGNNLEYVPDYQGNIRAVMKGNQVVQQTDYYPYGLPIATSTGAAANRYKYSGKEFETRGGLNSLDFHARQYAPALPFFDCLDPKAWDYPGTNPYLYCAANPIMFTDPTGEDIYRFDKNTGDIVLMQKTDDKFDQIGDYKYDKKTKEYTLKTDRKGNAKTKIDKIEKGILKDGINFKNTDNVIDIGGDGQPSLKGFQDFIMELSDLVEVEISGYEFTEHTDDAKNTSPQESVYVGKYLDNTDKDSFVLDVQSIHNKGAYFRFKNFHSHWHTHPAYRSESNKPSETYYTAKIKMKKQGVVNFKILTFGFGEITY